MKAFGHQTELAELTLAAPQFPALPRMSFVHQKASERHWFLKWNSFIQCFDWFHQWVPLFWRRRRALRRTLPRWKPCKGWTLKEPLPKNKTRNGGCLTNKSGAKDLQWQMKLRKNFKDIRKLPSARARLIKNKDKSKSERRATFINLLYVV